MMKINIKIYYLIYISKIYFTFNQEYVILMLDIFCLRGSDEDNKF